MSVWANLFDSASPAVQRNMVADVVQMAKTECGVSLDARRAEKVARRILSGARSREALYRVSTARLCKLVRK